MRLFDDRAVLMNHDAKFFETPQAMRTWLQQHHATAGELFVGYHKSHAVRGGKRSITWPESVAQALCDLEGLGFDRVQLTEIAPGTLDRLRPLLPLRAVQV